MVVDIELTTVTLHGHDVAVRHAGHGPAILLIHGMAGSSTTWKPIIGRLAERFTVICPDLPGHGRSDKPRGDYSLGAYASGLRDLLRELGYDRATIVGQSLGGGIAMQFTYQYPQYCERMVLVGSGGLGNEVLGLLRALTFPGVEYLLPVAFPSFVRDGVESVTSVLSRFGLRPTPQLVEIWRVPTRRSPTPKPAWHSCTRCGRSSTSGVSESAPRTSCTSRPTSRR